jgi:hypothetical protein
MSLLPFLASALLGLQAPGPFAELADNDRVEIILKNKYSFTGTCFQIPKDKKQVTIKLHGYTDVDGTITFKAHSVLHVRKLPPLGSEAQEALLREIAESRESIKKSEETRRKREAEMAEKRKADEAKRQEADEKAKEKAKQYEEAVNFYNQFPEPDWGPEAYENIRGLLQYSPEQKLFFDNYSLWQKGKMFLEGTTPEEEPPKKSP